MDMTTQQTYDADVLLRRITIDPHICHGKPCIRGLRYPVEMLLELLSAGMTIEEILADYEDLERADLLAALVFARTRDTEINDISVQEQAIVVTKDADFVNSFTVHRLPYKLLLVSTGNIKNAHLETLFMKNIDDIIAAFGSHDFIELTRAMLIIHI